MARHLAAFGPRATGTGRRLRFTSRHMLARLRPDKYLISFAVSNAESGSVSKSATLLWIDMRCFSVKRGETVL